MSAPEVFTVVEAARFLKCGPKVVRRLCRLKRIKHSVLDARGSIRIARAAIEQFLLEGRGAK